MFGQLINYWKLTGDDQYNDIVSQALLFQIGEKDNYMPKNQTQSLVCWLLSNPCSMLTVYSGKR